MEETEARRLLGEARVAVLATLTPQGRPHLVPCCFVLARDTLYSAVDDAKPKSSLALKRLENIRSNSAASLLVQHYSEDWVSLWWIRVDGTARIGLAEKERAKALELLIAKYDQYRKAPPPGEVLAVDIGWWRSWPSV